MKGLVLNSTKSSEYEFQNKVLLATAKYMFLGIIFLYQEQNVDVILIHNQEHFTWLNYCKSLQCASTSHWPICREKQ